MLPAWRKSSLHGDGSWLRVFVEDSGSSLTHGALSLSSRCDHCDPDRMDGASGGGKYLRRTCKPSCGCCPDAINVAHLARPLASEARTALSHPLISSPRTLDTPALNLALRVGSGRWYLSKLQATCVFDPRNRYASKHHLAVMSHRN
jgi:hypothetical protein